MAIKHLKLGLGS